MLGTIDDAKVDAKVMQVKFEDTARIFERSCILQIALHGLLPRNKTEVEL